MSAPGRGSRETSRDMQTARETGQTREPCERRAEDVWESGSDCQPQTPNQVP